MDGQRFDLLTTRLGAATTRRALFRGGAALLLGPLLGRAAPAAAGPTATSCLGIGRRCGRRRQPGCGGCCTGHAERSATNRQRRCVCKRDLLPCARPDECCSAFCAVDCSGGTVKICRPGFTAGDC